MNPTKQDQGMRTIGQVAAQAGVPASTIRYYEQIGLLQAPPRVNGQRRYQDDIIQKLALIRLAQHAGFSIAEIQALLHDFPDDAPPSMRWQRLARQKLVELEEQMRTLQAMKALLEQTMQCQCETLEQCATLEKGCLDANDGHNRNRISLVEKLV